MTRGRCGSLGLHRTALSSAPPPPVYPGALTRTSEQPWDRRACPAAPECNKPREQQAQVKGQRQLTVAARPAELRREGSRCSASRGERPRFQKLCGQLTL